MKNINMFSSSVTTEPITNLKTKNLNWLLMLVLIVGLFNVNQSIGQIYNNTFTGASGCPTNGNTPTMAGNSTGAAVTRSTITCNSTANVFNSTTLNNTAAIVATSYIEFSATANAGYKLDLTSVSFFRQGTSTAPNKMEVRYSTDGFSTFTTWGAAPTTPTTGTVVTWDFADFSTATAGTVTFRIFPYGTTRCDLAATPAAAATGGFRIDDVTINGVVTSTGVSPVYSFSPTSLSGFVASSPNPSNALTTTITGSNLTPASGSITVNAPSNFQVSNNGTTWGASATFAYTGGNTFSQSIVYFRIAASAPVGVVSGTSTTSGGGVGTPPSVALSGTVYSGAFSSGNICVEVVGDGVTGLSNASARVNVWEFNTSGTITNQFAFPYAATLPVAAPWNVTESGSATSAGNLNLSSDGAYLSVPGYNQIPNVASVVATVTPTNKRVLSTINSTGTITTNAYDYFSGNNFRSIASNGYSYWASGTPTGGAGLYYQFNAAATPVSLGSVNTRVIKIFNNNLYYATATTGGAGIYQFGVNGIPINTSNVTTTRLTDLTYASSGSSSPYAFCINPAGNILYIADDAAHLNTSTQRGGIIKYTKSGSTWTYQYTLKVLSASTTGARGLEVNWSGANPVLYITTASNPPNQIVTLTDLGASSTGTVIATAPANFVFRGIQFSPVAPASAKVYSTATELNFAPQPVGGVSPEQSFNVSGSLYTGNLTVNAPTHFGVSLTSGGPYTASVNVGATPQNKTIYVAFQPTIIGSYTPNVTVVATGATTVNVKVTGDCVNQVNYYNVANSNVNDVTNWGLNTDGSGANPINFTSNAQVFNIVNTPSVATYITSYPEIRSDLGANPGTITNGSNQITFANPPACPTSPSSLAVGQIIAASSGIVAGTTITAISGLTITLSAPAVLNVTTTCYVDMISQNWTVSGVGSKIVVGDGTNPVTFIVPNGFSVTSTIDVKNSGELKLQNTTLPTFGSLSVNSVVNFNQTGAVSIPIVSGGYGGLKLQGGTPSATTDIRNLPTSSSIFSPTSSFTVNGDFTVEDVTLVGQTISPNTYLFLGKNMISNGAIYGESPLTSNNKLFSIVTLGNTVQDFSGSDVIRVRNLTSTKSAGGITISGDLTAYTNTNSTFPGVRLDYSGNSSLTVASGANLNSTGAATINLNFTGTSSVNVLGKINTSDNSSSTSGGGTAASSLFADMGTGTTFNLDAAGIIEISKDLNMKGVGTYTLDGDVIISTRTGTSSLQNDATAGAIVPTIKNLKYQPIGGGNLIIQPSTGSANINIGNLTIAGTATSCKIQANGNTVKISGDFTDTRTVDMLAAGTSTYEFNGTVAQSIVTNYAPGESFYNLKINNAAGVNFNGGSAPQLNIINAGTLTCNNGVLTTSFPKKISLKVTASIVETTNSYVSGIVETKRALQPSVNNTFGGIGIDINAAGAPANDSTLVKRTTASVSEGCIASSILRIFEVTPVVNTGLNATVVYKYLPNATELNDIFESDLALFAQLGTNPFVNISGFIGLDSVNNKITATSQNILGRYIATTPNPIGGNAVATGGTVANPNTLICANTATTITLTSFIGGIQWQKSSDPTVVSSWADIAGATNSTYNTGSVSVKTYYRALVDNPCYKIASNTVLVDISATPVVTISSVTSTTAKVSWTPFVVNSGTTYKITCSGGASSQIINNAVSPTTLTGLIPGQTLNVAVASTTTGCNQTGSSSTTTLCAAPSITSIVPSVTTTSFTVNWTGISGVTQYKIFYKPVSFQNTYYSIVVPGTSGANSYTFNNMGNSILYSVYVAAYGCPSGTSEGQRSTESFVTTFPNTVSCTPPTVSAVSNCYNQITVTITDSPSPSGWRVTFRRILPTETSGFAYTVTSQIVNLTVSLTTGSTWLVYAQRNCSTGPIIVSPLSNVQYVLVKPFCPPVQNLVLSTPNCNGFYATWNTDNCGGAGVLGYYLYMKKSSQLNYSAYFMGNTNFKYVNWLGAGTYSAYITSLTCNNSISPASTVQTVTTGANPGCRETEETVDAENLTEENSMVVEKENAAMNIFPNPTSSSFNVSIFSRNNTDEMFKIEVVNMVGQVVATSIVANENGIANTFLTMPDNASSGIYFVRTIVGSEILTQRVMLSK